MNPRTGWILLVAVVLVAFVSQGLGYRLGRASVTEAGAGNFADWDEVLGWLRAHYELEESDALGAELVFDNEGRAQAVFVSPYESMGQPWLEVASAVGAHEEVSIQNVLERTYAHGLGALVIDAEHDIVVLRATFPLDRCDPAALELAMGAIANSADELEEEFTGLDTF